MIKREFKLYDCMNWEEVLRVIHTLDENKVYDIEIKPYSSIDHYTGKSKFEYYEVSVIF